VVDESSNRAPPRAAGFVLSLSPGGARAGGLPQQQRGPRRPVLQVRYSGTSREELRGPPSLNVCCARVRKDPTITGWAVKPVGLPKEGREAREREDGARSAWRTHGGSSRRARVRAGPTPTLTARAADHGEGTGTSPVPALTARRANHGTGTSSGLPNTAAAGLVANGRGMEPSLAL